MSLRVDASLSGDSKKSSVRDSDRKARSRLRRATFLPGRNPRNAKESVGLPEMLRGGNDRAGSGDWRNADAVLQGGPNQAISRIGDGWRSRIADQGDVRSRFQPFQQPTGSLLLIVFMVAGGGSRNLVVGQQFSGVAGVLAGDQVSFTKDAQCAQGNIFQVPDRCGYHEECSCHKSPGGYIPQSRR